MWTGFRGAVASFRVMRSRLALCAITVLLVGVANAKAFETRERDAPWRLAGIGRDGRTLKLAYEGGGCLGNDGRPQVVEGERRVTIRVRQTQAIPGPGEGCPANLEVLAVRTRLAQPLAGRRVVGGPRFDHPTFSRRVPRLIGLHRRDASELLRMDFFRFATIGRGTTVIGQSPAPGTRIRRRLPRMRLFLGSAVRTTDVRPIRGGNQFLSHNAWRPRTTW